MKLWQLHSIMRDCPSTISSIALTRADWRYIAEWMTDFTNLVRRQDRSKLDFILPDEFVRTVLSRLTLSFYLNADNQHLRSYSINRSREERLSAVEAYERFGGDVLEDLLEKGGTFNLNWLKRD